MPAFGWGRLLLSGCMLLLSCRMLAQVFERVQHSLGQQCMAVVAWVSVSHCSAVQPEYGHMPRCAALKQAHAHLNSDSQC